MNRGKITLCPYYLSDNQKSVSCEDTIRRFSSKKAKDKHVDKYCCTYGYQECPYAKDLTKLYDRIEKSRPGERSELYLRHRVEVLSKELGKVSSMLGKAEKQLEDWQK